MYNIKISGYENFGQCAVQKKNGYAVQKKTDKPSKRNPFPGTQRRFPQIETSAPKTDPKTNENGT